MGSPKKNTVAKVESVCGKAETYPKLENKLLKCNLNPFEVVVHCPSIKNASTQSDVPG